MDLSVYITELLNEQGIISIPQIGVFRQVRKRGYYNADEGKLYPPYYETEFEFKPVDDDSLLQYLTAKSKVSTSSAKYFMDKYLHNILQQAEIGEAMLGRLGWITKDGDVLQFRPAPAITSNSGAFGFAPVNVQTEPAPVPKEVPTPAAPDVAQHDSIQEAVSPTKTKVTPVYSVEKNDEVVATPKPAPIVSASANASLLRQPAPAGDKPSAPVTVPAKGIETPGEPALPAAAETVEHTKPFYIKPWFFGLVAGVIAIACIIIFYPSQENTVSKSSVNKKTGPPPSMDSVKVAAPAVTAPVVKDTIAKPKAKAETVMTAGNKPLPASTEFAPEVETPAKPVLVNTNGYRFALMSGAFSTEEAAEKVVWRYKSIKVEAAIIKNISRSKYFKVTLGFFKTYAEGKAAKIKLVKEKHLRDRDLYVETLKIKKK